MFNKFMRKYGILCIALSILCGVFLLGYFFGCSTTERIYLSAPVRETAVQSKAAVSPPMVQPREIVEEQTEIVEEDKPEEITVTATAYCACGKCCGKWAENRPDGIVYTASGTVAKAGRTIAVDPDVFPFGTVLEIDGVEYVAEDTGSAIKGYKIDIYFDNHDAALDFGVRELVALVIEEGAQ